MGIDKAGEVNHRKEVVPDKDEVDKEVDQLLHYVHGAIVARIQLGFDKVSDEEWNLQPIIRDLQVKVASQITPLINK